MTHVSWVAMGTYVIQYIVFHLTMTHTPQLLLCVIHSVNTSQYPVNSQSFCEHQYFWSSMMQSQSKTQLAFLPVVQELMLFIKWINSKSPTIYRSRTYFSGITLKSSFYWLSWANKCLNNQEISEKPKRRSEWRRTTLVCEIMRRVWRDVCDGEIDKKWFFDTRTKPRRTATTSSELETYLF